MKRFSALALCIALAFGWLVLGTHAALAEDHAAESSGDNGHGEKKKSGGVGGLLNSGPTYINVGPLLFPVITDEGPKQIVSMIVAIQVKDLATSDKVREKLPRLIDAFTRSIYGHLDASKLHGEMVDLDFVKDRIIKAAEEIMGRGIIDDVLIQAVAQRPV
ncbi:MAG: hypothetical protein GC131_00595 [Alphaproteobacteria bacterium]|nr:hypothetical protein [Alphaproteobacteria bacterium]